jgi:hypothetical protein
VFAALTDIARLPEWNECIAAVLSAPDAPLAQGTEWVVQMSISRSPAKWPSRARVVAYDPEHLRLEHTSQSDDGNPTYVRWQWSVAPHAGGARLTVAWDGYPKTFWRRLLLARMRRRQLEREVPSSLHALAYHLAPADLVR